MVPPDQSNAVRLEGVYASAYAPKGRSGVLAVLKVVVILALWAAGFVAFLMAPLVVLGVAWIVALAVLSAKQRSRPARRADSGAAAQPHRFGAARANTEVSR